MDLGKRLADVQQLTGLRHSRRGQRPPAGATTGVRTPCGRMHESPDTHAAQPIFRAPDLPATQRWESSPSTQSISSGTCLPPRHDSPPVTIDPDFDTELWLLWDSGNQGPTFLAPWAAAALGVTGSAGEHALALGGRDVTVPVEVKEIIHDGVLNARLVERAAWSIDLANARMWMSDVAPLLALPPAAPGARVIPPRSDATGWYDLTLVVNGAPQRSLLHVHDGGAELRFIGEERVFSLGDVRADGARLAFTLPMNRPYRVHLEFDGLRGSGSWGDADRGGAAEAVKVR